MTTSPIYLPDLDITLPPTQEDLPYDDGVPMESQRHKLQMDLLIDTLLPWLDDREDGYVGGNMFVYYSLSQVKNQDFKGPDVFVALNVPKGERKSWVCWEENKCPDVVIELLSTSTTAMDKGEKKWIYQTRLRVPEYFWYDPFNTADLAGFQLVAGQYEAIPPNAQNQLASQLLGLVLVRWQGVFKGVETTWLRWAYPDGRLLPTTTEQEAQRAEQEAQRAEQEAQRAEQAELQVLKIAQNLLQSGMEPLQVAQITGLPMAQIEAL